MADLGAADDHDAPGVVAVGLFAQRLVELPEGGRGVATERDHTEVDAETAREAPGHGGYLLGHRVHHPRGAGGERDIASPLQRIHAHGVAARRLKQLAAQLAHDAEPRHDSVLAEQRHRAAYGVDRGGGQVHRRGVVEPQPRGNRRAQVLRHHRVVRVIGHPRTHAGDLVAGAEAGNTGADGHHRAGVGVAERPPPEVGVRRAAEPSGPAQLGAGG